MVILVPRPLALLLFGRTRGALVLRGIVAVILGLAAVVGHLAGGSQWERGALLLLYLFAFFDLLHSAFGVIALANWIWHRWWSTLLVGIACFAVAFGVVLALPARSLFFVYAGIAVAVAGILVGRGFREDHLLTVSGVAWLLFGLLASLVRSIGGSTSSATELLPSYDLLASVCAIVFGAVLFVLTQRLAGRRPYPEAWHRSR